MDKPNALKHEQGDTRLSAALAVMILARITLNISYRIPYPFLPVIARGLGVGLPAAGFLVTARAGGSLASPILGPLSDRFGRRRLMLIGLALLILAAGLCAAVPRYPAFFIAFILFGVAKSAYDPAMQAYVGDRVPYERRGLALGITELSWSAAWLLGVPAAGWLIATAGWQSPFALVGALGLLGMLLVGWQLADSPHRAGPAARLPLGSVLRNPRLLAALGAAFLLTLANETTFIVYGAWMEERFHLSVVGLGLASLVIGVAEAVGEFGSAALTDRIGKWRSVLIGLAGLALVYAALPVLSQKLEWMLAGLALLFVVFEFTIVSFLPLMSELVPQARATTLSANLAAATLGRMAGSSSGALIFAYGGQIGLNAGASAIVSILAFAILWALRQKSSAFAAGGYSSE